MRSRRPRTVQRHARRLVRRDRRAVRSRSHAEARYVGRRPDERGLTACTCSGLCCGVPTNQPARVMRSVGRRIPSTRRLTAEVERRIATQRDEDVLELQVAVHATPCACACCARRQKRSRAGIVMPLARVEGARLSLPAPESGAPSTGSSRIRRRERRHSPCSRPCRARARYQDDRGRARIAASPLEPPAALGVQRDCAAMRFTA